jgi:hypothetical protein
MGMCAITADPYESDPGSSFNPKIRWKNSWTTAITPPGSITHTHLDGIGCSQFMVHFWGKKLWLFWPPTEENLRFYGRYHTQLAPQSLTMDSIQHLSGLQLHYIDNAYSACILPPNYLHAVISITASAHAGISFCHFSHVLESIRMMKWFLEWAKGSSIYGHTAKESVEIIEQVVQKGVGRWQEMIKVHKDIPGALSVKEDLDKLKGEAVHLLKMLSRS